MNFYRIIFISVLIVLFAISAIDAKKHKRHRSSASSPSSKTKTKTKWSTSSDLGRSGAHLATEEHGYYVKRTFLPLNSSSSYQIAAPRSPPYLGIPIAWFACEGAACTKANTAAISGSAAALQDGFLCNDDCVEPYEPICGKTPSELAVFYNKCKLNVAKCRTHGLWLDVAYEECKKSNPKEVAYAERKFKTSPFFRDTKTVIAVEKQVDVKTKEDDSSEEDTMLDVALQTLDKIGDQIAEAEAAALDEASATTVKNEVSAPFVKPVHEDNVSVSNPKKESKPIIKPIKEISTADKPVKTMDAKKAEENSVSKPVASNNLKPNVSGVVQQAGSNTVRLVAKK